MDAGTALDDARPENVRALIDFTKEYGVTANIASPLCGRGLKVRKFTEITIMSARS